MNRGLLLFTPYIGDTILASAWAKRFSVKFDKEVFVAQLEPDVQHFASKFLGTLTYSDYKIQDLLRAGSRIDTPLKKEYRQGHIFYRYEPSTDLKKDLQKLCVEILNSLDDYQIDEYFICHYSYPLALFGEMARARGKKVHGYFTKPDGQLVMSHYTDSQPAVIWDKQYIGDRVSKLITGMPLNRHKDFITFQGEYIRDKVILFPQTRSGGGNGHWVLDSEVLKYRGYKTSVAWHGSEPVEVALGNNVFEIFPLGYDINAMLEYIKTAKFIICYDSAAFHMAWLTNTPAIVKLKGGFNHEWIPTWVSADSKFQFISSESMYEEEYLEQVQQAINNLSR
jgi:hypothetical protein